MSQCKHIPTVLLLIATIFGFLGTRAQQVTFSKSYGGAQNDAANGAIEISTGGYLLVGYTTNGGIKDGNIVRLDANGNLVWAKTFGGAANDYFNAITETADGNFIAVGTTASDPSLTTAGCSFVVKIDGSGNILWSKIFTPLTVRDATHGTSSSQAIAVKELSGGTIFVGIHDIQPVVNAANSGFILLNPDGSLIRLIRDDTDANGTRGSLYAFPFEMSNGDLMLFSSPYSSSGYGRYDAGLHRLTKTGTVKFSKIYGGYQWDDSGNSFITLKSKEFFLVGGRSNQPRNANYPIMYRLDTLGSLKWTGTLTIPGDTLLNGYGSAEVAPNDYVMGMGDGKTDMYLARFREDTVLWTKAYGGPGAESMGVMLGTKDGGFLLAGSTTYGGQIDMYIVKTDSMGNTDCFRNISGTVLQTITNNQTNRLNTAYTVQNNQAATTPTVGTFSGTVKNYSLQVTTLSDTICPLTNSGAVSVTAVGTPNYTYSWNTTPARTTSQITGLPGGTYIVTVNDANNCQRIDTALVVETAPPAVTVNNITDATCSSKNGSATVTATGIYGPYVYTWNTNPVTNGSTMQNVDSGYYKCSIKDAGGCIIDTTIRINLASIAPVFSMGPDVSICSGDSAYIGTNTAADAYVWNTVPVQNTAHIYAKNNFQYRLTLTSGSCSYTDTIQVTVKPLPIFDLGSDINGCSSSPPTIGTNVTADSYTWNPANTNTSTIQAGNTGKYKLILSLNGCTYQDSINVTIYATPVFSLGPDITFCADTDSLIGTNTVADSYLWNFGAPETTPTVRVDSTGEYKLTLVRNGCSYADSMNVTVNPLPIFDLGPDKPVCAGSTVSIGTSVYADGYDWNTNPVQHSPYISVGTTNDYALTLTRLGCKYSDTIHVTTYQTPVFNLGNDTTFCSSHSIPIGVTGINGKFLWNTGDTLPLILSGEQGTYILSIDDHGCVGSDSINILFFPGPYDYPRDTAICLTDTITISGFCAGCSYVWENGDTINYQRVYAHMTKILTITDTNNCPYNYTVDIDNSYDIQCDMEVYAPNCFTPDGDGYNEFFCLNGLYINTMKMYIFNRWGEEIFNENSEKPIWDGTYDGTPCPIGIYAWKAEVFFITGEKRFLRGHVSIVR